MRLLEGKYSLALGGAPLMDTNAGEAEALLNLHKIGFVEVKTW